MSKKCPKFLILQILHQYIDFSLPSSTISSYFNSSYYLFLTFLTLYLISFKISQKKFSHETQWGVLTPKTPPCLRLWPGSIWTDLQFVYGECVGAGGTDRCLELGRLTMMNEWMDGYIIIIGQWSTATWLSSYILWVVLERPSKEATSNISLASGFGSPCCVRLKHPWSGLLLTML